MSNQLNSRQEIWRGILYSQRSMMLRLVAELKKDFSLSVTQYEALLSLWESPKQSLAASELAGRLLYSSGSASHLVARLEDLGHVSRAVNGKDARVVEIALTESGRDLIERATRAHVASLEREFEPLVADEEVDHVLRFARRWAEHEGVVSQPSDLTSLESRAAE